MKTFIIDNHTWTVDRFGSLSDPSIPFGDYKYYFVKDAQDFRRMIKVDKQNVASYVVKYEIDNIIHEIKAKLHLAKALKALQDSLHVEPLREGDHMYYHSFGVAEPHYIGRIYEICDYSSSLKILDRKGNFNYYTTNEGYVRKGPAVYPLILLPGKTGF